MASSFIENPPRTSGPESVGSIIYRDTIPTLVSRTAMGHGIRLSPQAVIDTALGIYGKDELMELPKEWPLGVLDHLVVERNTRCFEHMPAAEAPKVCETCGESLHDEQYQAGVTSQCTIRICPDPECANNHIICLY